MYNIEICYNRNDRRGVVTVGRESDASLAWYRVNHLKVFVNEDVVKLRVYDQRIMKEKRVAIRDEAGYWVEVEPNSPASFGS